MGVNKDTEAFGIYHPVLIYGTEKWVTNVLAEFFSFINKTAASEFIEGFKSTPECCACLKELAGLTPSLHDAKNAEGHYMCKKCWKLYIDNQFGDVSVPCVEKNL